MFIVLSDPTHAPRKPDRNAGARVILALIGKFHFLITCLFQLKNILFLHRYGHHNNKKKSDGVRNKIKIHSNDGETDVHCSDHTSPAAGTIGLRPHFFFFWFFFSLSLSLHAIFLITTSITQKSLTLIPHFARPPPLLL